MTKHRKVSARKRRGMLITKLMARDGCDCRICGQPLERSVSDPESWQYITFDHVIPSSMGGSSKEDNLRLTHLLCNQLRGTNPVEWEAIQ
ncbi:MAG TPA: HNH endonuclease [Haliangium sp.]|nr:HNH endonuclease [Haliangium sp.]